MNPIDRLARSCVVAAARRWPADLSEDLRREWCAELDALRVDPTSGPLGRAWLAITFATSLLVRPAVEPAGAAARTGRDRARDLGSALLRVATLSAVVLLGAGLFNVVHDVDHVLGRGSSAVGLSLVNGALLVLGMGLMWSVGAFMARRWPVAGSRAAVLAGTGVVALALYAFLLAGNQVAVMPFMGWMDLAPAIGAWAVLLAFAMSVASRVRRAGRHAWAAVTGAVGVLVAMDGAAGFGSLHAASVLGVDAGSAPAWFPLALMPGQTVHFGRIFGPGVAPFGPARPMVPTFHGSDLLLGNVSVMVGPLLLCSIFLMAYASRAPGARAARQVTPAIASGGGRVLRPGTGPTLTRGTSHVVAWIGILAGVAGIAGGARLSAVTPDPSVVFARIGDNSAVFGFGFAADPGGRAVLILVLGLCLIGLVRRGAPAGHQA